MGMRLKIGHYIAEEEPSPPLSAGKLWVILGVLTLPLVTIYGLSLGKSHAVEAVPRAQVAREIAGGGSAEVGARSEAPDAYFASSNWNNLERRPSPPPPKALATDLECPEWQGREVYKELKAMAVYECKPEPVQDRPQRDLIEKVRREGRGDS